MGLAEAETQVLNSLTSASQAMTARRESKRQEKRDKSLNAYSNAMAALLRKERKMKDDEFRLEEQKAEATLNNSLAFLQQAQATKMGMEITSATNIGAQLGTNFSDLMTQFASGQITYDEALVALTQMKAAIGTNLQTNPAYAPLLMQLQTYQYRLDSARQQLEAEKAQAAKPGLWSRMSSWINTGIDSLLHPTLPPGSATPIDQLPSRKGPTKKPAPMTPTPNSSQTPLHTLPIPGIAPF